MPVGYIDAELEPRALPGIRWDHRPPLATRAIRDDGSDWEPAQQDPRYIDALTKACHDARTYRGRSGATSLGSDAHAIAKMRRLTSEKGEKINRWPKRRMRQ